MATRLDRLFLLLESGSTPVIRKSAAEQLGEVQKLHPHEFHNLLTKVHMYLVSSQWETRIAAGQAVEAIARNVPQWEPHGAAKKEEEASAEPLNHSRLVFSLFDIRRVLTYGASLLGSEGAEYDLQEEILGLDQKERLAQQKRLLNKRLGLDIAGGLGMTSDDLYGEEDLVMRSEMPQNWPGASGHKQSNVADLVRQQLQGGGAPGALSARERNRAKRKAKQFAKQVSKEADKATNGEGSDTEPSSKKRKTTTVVVEQTSGDDKLVVDNVADNTMNMEEMDEWPFESFCELLMNDLFHASWERRHGAATGLREVLKLHGRGAGKTTDTPANQLDCENQHWLEDLALRMVCVLALDRFGDFVADEVVAPVRETCAQTLGVVLQHMAGAGVQGMVHVLLQLLGQHQWEVRHGGLLGLKYLLAIRKDMSAILLPQLLPALFMGLQDHDDDVRAVAAAALLPVADQFVATLPQQIPAIVQCLWFTLLDLDDLTASTNSIMMLLSTLLAHPRVNVEAMSGLSLSELVPRLWPFLRHNIASVRMATLETLNTLLTKVKVDSQEAPATASWLVPILQDALRHIYQRTLVEERKDVLELVHRAWCALLAGSPPDHLVAASLPWMGVWLCLMMQPSNLLFDQSLLIEARHQPKENTPSRLRHSNEQQNQQQNKEQRDYIGGTTSLNESQQERDLHVTRARIFAARCLGLLCSYQIQNISSLPEGMESPAESLTRLLLFHLNSKSALQRFCVAHVTKHWAVATKDCSCPETVKMRMMECLSEAIYYDEIVIAFSRMQTECQDFIASLRQQGLELDETFCSGSVLSLEQAQSLVTTVFDSLRPALKPKWQQGFDDRRKHLAATVSSTNLEQQMLASRVQSSLAGALIELGTLPEKLNPVIRPLMESLRKEQNAQLQMEAASSLSHLLLLCTTRTPCPNPKVIKNLCSMLCADPSHTPHIDQEATPSTSSDASAKEPICDKYSGILTLNTQIKESEQSGRKMSLVRRHVQGSLDVPSEVGTAEDAEAKRLLVLQQRGAVAALSRLATDTTCDLPTRIPYLWESMLQKLGTLDPEAFDANKLKENHSEAQELVNSLQVLEVVGVALHSSLHTQLVEKLPHICKCLEYPHTAVRHMAARCLGKFSRLVTMETMNCVLTWVLPLLGAADHVTKRQGSIEALANLIEQLGLDLVPYIVLLVIPILGCISDQNEAVRQMATHCFATLIKLMPLEAGIPDPPEMSTKMSERREQERHFLEQLLNVNKLDGFSVPVPIQAQLRKYQQDGVNWLWFLNCYKLHGILCDDMGLGKTLQSICILAGDHFLCKQQAQNTKDICSASLPSIVVCPPTLTGHWVYEVEKFVSREYLNPLHYTGPPAERARLQKRVKAHNVVVASYDVVRNDIDFFGKLKWNYCILDEGHIIKNSKTKMSRAVKQLECRHRLILSGTPIQNNVLELWSLFDFLMPGYLGTERQFQQRYGKPILQSRDAKSSSREQEAGALAMEALHRQVLPFLLRRMKEDVLKDLPPKIIQDYYCDLSPLQVRLYEDFARSRAKKSVDDIVTGQTEDKKQNTHGGHTHIFQALQYLRKVCNHPALVVTGQHPEYEGIKAELKQKGSSLRDLQHAPKLTALKQLLLDCGLGGGGGGGTEGAEEPVVNQHRVLLFCQLKSMLDIVEHDLLKSQMPSVTYLRLDGSVPAGSRHGIVNRFNNDPSIDVLLLTTHVGGLGLNLTGADTVIFVEHDWNPMKDLQAMDRAHRIGQKKVVNVYRLITRCTLEEKIMGLQKFKLNIANTIISQDNSSLTSMGTDQLLDLFSLDDAKSDQPRAGNHGDKQQSMKSMLENMEDLWDEKQYENEYDLTNFMKSLSK